jgi:alpha-galactosidase
VSTSDQTDYRKYPYIAANILSAVLPEQAAVWSYPVESPYQIGEAFDESAESVNARVTEEAVIMNMINSFLGRMHLASHVELLSDDKRALIAEGIACYKSIAAAKKNAVPYFPLGFTDFSKDFAASGFIAGGVLYLAVWNLQGAKTVTVPLPGLSVKYAEIAYPRAHGTPFCCTESELTVKFTAPFQARFFEIILACAEQA